MGSHYCRSWLYCYCCEYYHCFHEPCRSQGRTGHFCGPGIFDKDVWRPEGPRRAEGPTGFLYPVYNESEACCELTEIPSAPGRSTPVPFQSVFGNPEKESNDLKTELTSYLDELTEYVSINKEIIGTLKSIRREAEEVRETSKLFQLNGVVYGAVAVSSALCGIYLAPVTAGQSLWLPKLTLGATLGGLSTSVMDGILEPFESNKLVEKIKAQQNKHVRSVKRLNRAQDEIREMFETPNQKGYSPDVATVSPYVNLGKNIAKLVKGTKGAIDAAKAMQMAIRNPYGEVMAAFKRSIALKVVFTARDITMLAYNWNEAHQLDGEIEEFIKKLENDCISHRNMINLIEALAN